MADAAATAEFNEKRWKTLQHSSTDQKQSTNETAERTHTERINTGTSIPGWPTLIVAKAYAACTPPPATRTNFYLPPYPHQP